MNHTNTGNEVCSCGKKAIQWKYGWVCEACNEIEEMRSLRDRAERKDRGTKKTPARDIPIIPHYYSVNLRRGSL